MPSEFRDGAAAPLKRGRVVRVILMGTPEFALPTLRALAAYHEVVAVYSRPDAVSGRGAKTRPSPVSSLAHELDLPVLTPRSLRDTDVHAQLRAADADAIVVAAYGLILPLEVLKAAPLGAVNVHASLLPRWRGAAPIQRAILAGDKITGVSIMRMEEGLDTGPYCAQVTLDLDDLDAAAATARLGELGAQALLGALAAIDSGTAAWIAQDESQVTYAEKLTKADVALDPELGAEQALLHIRASLPATPCRITLAGRAATVLSAGRSHLDAAPGVVAVTKSELAIGLADAAISLLRVKPDGKAEMDGAAWARGTRDLAGSGWQCAS
jgi:methionyl-tRNA formyltransferase